MASQYNRVRRFRALSAASALAIAACFSQGSFAEDGTKSFDIPAQPLGKALTDFSKQSDVIVVAPMALTTGKTSNALKGEMSLEAALDVLLGESDLEYQTEDDGSVILTLASAQSTGEQRTEPFRLAQLDHEEDRDVELRDDEDDEGPEEIIVTGTNIRGVVPDSAPFEVFTAEDIAKSGATTLERFFETIPQNLNSITPVGARFGPGRGERLEAGIDLRGLGVGTTLVLLNGRRLTAPSGGSPDISLIPFGAIDRVELLTDGASAVYGADAIGGVVNIILKDELDGAETQLSYGTVTDGNHQRFKASQSIGTSWNSGNVLLAYGFQDQSVLESSDRDFVLIDDPTTLAPSEQKHSLFLTAKQKLTDQISVFGDALYSSRNSFISIQETAASGNAAAESYSLDQEQVFLSGGSNYDLSDDHRLQIDGNYLHSDRMLLTGDPIGDFTQERSSSAEAFELTAKVDGKLVILPGGDSKFSVGGGYFEHEYTIPPLIIRGVQQPIDTAKLERDYHFLFAEVFLPLVSEEQNIPGIRRLELNAAARYTDYSDFGSSTVPRFGLLWSPFEGLNIRGTFAEGFRAPTLAELNPNAGSASLFPPALFGLPDFYSDDGSTVMLLLFGQGGKDLTPEFSESYTLGFDYAPVWAESLDISFTFFNIDYVDRLATPDSSNTFLFSSEDAAEIVNDDPTRAEIIDAISAYPEVLDRYAVLADPNDIDQLVGVVNVIIDNRLDNLAIAKTNGIDFSLNYSKSMSIGDVGLGGRLTYTLESIQRANESSSDITLLDTLGNPVSLKFTTYAGLSRGPFSSRFNVNYIDGNTNVFVEPEEPIDSWVTVDLNMRYSFGEDRSWLSDSVLSLNINNLFDRDPPFVRQSEFTGPEGRGLTFGVGYDPVNANPIGRLVTIGLTKRF